MTANELADYLDNNVEAMLFSEQSYIDQAAAMLRQQQAEIERLGSELNRIVELYTDKAIENEALKLRELTDEEIAQESAKFYPDVFHTHLIQFAKALLKKASEK